MRRGLIAAGLCGLLGAGFWASQTPDPVPMQSPFSQPALKQHALSQPDQPLTNQPQQQPAVSAEPAPVIGPAVPPLVVVDAQKAGKIAAPRSPSGAAREQLAPIAPLPLSARTANAPIDLEAKSVSGPLPKPGRAAIVPPKNGDIPGQPPTVAATVPVLPVVKPAPPALAQSSPPRAVAQTPRRTALKQVVVRDPIPAAGTATRKPSRLPTGIPPTQSSQTRPRLLASRTVLRGVTVPPFRSISALSATAPRQSPAPRLAPAPRVVQNPS